MLSYRPLRSRTTGTDSDDPTFAGNFALFPKVRKRLLKPSLPFKDEASNRQNHGIRQVRGSLDSVPGSAIRRITSESLHHGSSQLMWLTDSESQQLFPEPARVGLEHPGSIKTSVIGRIEGPEIRPCRSTFSHLAPNPEGSGLNVLLERARLENRIRTTKKFACPAGKRHASNDLRLLTPSMAQQQLVEKPFSH